MTIEAAYASSTAYFGQFNKTQNRDAETVKRQLITTSRWIDRKLYPLFFYLEETPSTRIYRPGAAMAPIASTDGLVVKVGSGYPVDWDSYTALTLGADFELLPDGAPDDAVDPRPYTDLFLVSYGMTPLSRWEPKNYRPEDYRVSVNGIHGWPGGVPTAIVDATLIFTSMLRGEGPWATQAFASLDQAEQQSLQARALIKDLIQQFHPTGITIG